MKESKEPQRAEAAMKDEQESALHRYWGLGILFLSAMLVLAGIYSFGGISVAETSSRAGNRDLPIYSVDTEKKQVALTFDAAWGNDDTVSILEILAKHKIHATFFMTGGWVSSYPEDVKRITAAGHELGNHSETHKNMSQLSNEQCRQEILSVHEKVKKLTGIEMQLFRPPYGDYDNHVITNAYSLNYYPIEWSVDSLDWKDYGVDSIIHTILQNKDLKNGAIILMHNGAKYTASALEMVITGLEQKGFEIVPVSQLIYKENFHMDPTGKQISDT